MGLDDAVADRLWTAVIPVKGFTAAKSRLALPAAAELAEAFLADVLGAVHACPQVESTIVVTADPDVADLAGRLGASVVPESSSGINAAAADGAAAARDGAPVVVLVADLPCLTAETLGHVLDAAAAHPASFLADADGLGTAMWCGTSVPVRTEFGIGSRSAHAASGAVDLVVEHPDTQWAPARRDVDTAADLADAAVLGVGPATQVLISDLAVVTVVSIDAPSPHGLRVVDEQGQVAPMEPPTGIGPLRPGQRLLRFGGQLVGLH